jgi:cytochrome P450
MGGALSALPKRKELQMSHLRSKSLLKGSAEDIAARQRKVRNSALLLGGMVIGVGLLRARRRWKERRSADVPTAEPGLPIMSLVDTIGFIADIPMPNLAKGVIKRRKQVVGMAEAMNLEKRAVRRMQLLHEKYGPGPVLLKIPVRNQAVILEPAHVHDVLNNSPEPFATASSEKKAALSHFEPYGALISHGLERAERRRFNEQVLQSECPIHSLAGRFREVVAQEVQELVAGTSPTGEFGWDDFSEAWFRTVRRVVLGDSARHDRSFHRLLTKLRYDANWAFLKPRRDHLRKAFLEQLRAHLDRAEPGSLASVIASAPKDERTKPEHQVPQWLFAFDPAGMATNRALALLAAHPEQARRAHHEIEAERGGEQRLPFLRAAILESLRLWPTTPLILRQTTRKTRWEAGTMPAGSGVAIFAPYFHRDDRNLVFANRFSPDIWFQDPPAGGWPLVPFSGGPGICPAKNLVLLLGSNFLAELLDGRQFGLSGPERLDPDELPATFDHYSMRYRLSGFPAGDADRASARQGATGQM